jgi:Zn-dependent M16 (insulinase) family peptidase
MAFLARLTASTLLHGGCGGASAFRVVVGTNVPRSFGISPSSSAFPSSAVVGRFASSSSSSSAAASTTCLGSTVEASTSSSIVKTVIEHPSFDVVQTDTIPEYGASCTLYRHRKSGAELLSLVTDDDNKCFGITFRTPPRDSTGVPHILEHSVLCGSRKYTTKDPFVQLLQGSLQTFLNAFTYPDRTCYVVASQNTKDFYNLINVYSDAVFHPRAVNDPMVHAQEGWHLELEKMDDPLTYKGVVYNEMKGVYSSPDSLLQREAQQSVFPDNAYGVDSGGDPSVIPDLSFEQFAEFHSKYYHPANSRIFFAGDDDVSKRLDIMDEYLRDFEDSPESKPGSKIEWQRKRYVEPVTVRHPYPVSDKGEEGEPDTHLTMTNWLLNDRPMTAMEEITLTVLDHLLTGTTSSILRKTLMESGLGEAITGGGLSDELMQATFSMGLKGVKPENVGRVEELVVDTLKKVAEEGFPEDAVAASMNTIEFQLREFNTGSFPKGLSLMLGSMSKWVYDQNPTEALKFEAPLAELKSSIAKDGSRVFQDMIKEFLLENSHRTTVEMFPSKSLEEEQLTVRSHRSVGSMLAILIIFLRFSHMIHLVFPLQLFRRRRKGSQRSRHLLVKRTFRASSIRRSH